MNLSNSVHGWQRGTALLMALGMTAGAVPSLLIAAPAFAQTGFNDVQGSWAQACIDDLARRNVISGYPDGSFRPTAPVTRAEFAAMLGKAFPNAPQDRSAAVFVDVPSGSWAYAPIQTAARTGFLSGYPGNTFQPNQNIPRVQVLVALASGLRYAPAGSVSELLSTSFDDANSIPSYAQSGIAAATEKQLVVNYPNVRLLNPNLLASRAEVSAFLCQALANGTTALIPAQYIAGIPAQPVSTALPVGTAIPVRYGESKRLIVGVQETVPLTLTSAANLANAQGEILIPAGSQIVGAMQPRPQGSQFVAQEVIVGDRRLPLQAESQVITRTKNVNDPSLLGVVRNSVLGAAAAAGISALVGNKTITAQKVIPGAAVGAAIETNQGRSVTAIARDTVLGAAAAAGISALVGNKTITAEKVISGAAAGAAIGGVIDHPAKQVVVIETDTDLTLTLNSSFAKN